MWTGVLCGLLAGALWGMVFVVPVLLAKFSAVELAVGRYLVYGIIAFVLMLPRPLALLRRLNSADCLTLLRHACSGNIVYYTLLSLGVKLAGVAPTSLIIGVLPISVTLLGHKDQGAVPLRQLALPLLVVAAGIACINVDVFSHAEAGGGKLVRTLLGVLAAIGALLCWSWYAVDNARYLKRNPHFSSAEWSGLYGLSSGLLALLIGGAAFFIWRDDISGAGAIASGRDWSLFWIVNALLALGASAIGNQLWNVASRRVPVTLSGQLILFETLFALLYGFLYEHRYPRALEMAALGLLIAGVAWSMRIHGQQEEAVPA